MKTAKYLKVVKDHLSYPMSAMTLAQMSSRTGFSQKSIEPLTRAVEHNFHGIDGLVERESGRNNIFTLAPKQGSLGCVASVVLDLIQRCDTPPTAYHIANFLTFLSLQEVRVILWQLQRAGWIEVTPDGPDGHERYRHLETHLSKREKIRIFLAYHPMSSANVIAEALGDSGSNIYAFLCGLEDAPVPGIARVDTGKETIQASTVDDSVLWTFAVTGPQIIGQILRTISEYKWSSTELVDTWISESLPEHQQGWAKRKISKMVKEGYLTDDMARERFNAGVAIRLCLEDNFPYPLTINEIAEQTGINPSSLHGALARDSCFFLASGENEPIQQYQTHPLVWDVSSMDEAYGATVSCVTKAYLSLQAKSDTTDNQTDILKPRKSQASAPTEQPSSDKEAAPTMNTDVASADSTTIDIHEVAPQMEISLEAQLAKEEKRLIAIRKAKLLMANMHDLRDEKHMSSVAYASAANAVVQARELLAVARERNAEACVKYNKAVSNSLAYIQETLS